MSKTGENFVRMYEATGLDEAVEHFVEIGGLCGISTLGHRRVLFLLADHSFVVFREEEGGQRRIDGVEVLEDIEALANYCKYQGDEGLWEDIVESAPEGQVGIRIDRAFGDFENIPTSPIQ